MGLRAALTALIVTLGAGPAISHEFWIDPLSYQVAQGENLIADLRVGENLEGAAYSFVPPNFLRFEIVTGDSVVPVDGRAGDRPALNMAALASGLAVVVHVTRDYSLMYREWDKFVNFVQHKDFAWALDDHAARGLPQTDFRETYSRHAKSLIAVGNGAGTDRQVGLLTEIVALANPYTDDVSGGFPVQVYYQGAVRADTQVELFDRDADGVVTVSLHRTDSEGRTLLPVTAGHSYLVDAVVMRPLVPEVEGDAVWESLWASLTFAVPD